MLTASTLGERTVAHVRRALPTVLYSGVTAGLALLAGALLARALGPAHRGELASVIVWVGILATVGDLGVGFAIAYFVAKAPERRDDLWSQAILYALGAGVPLALGAAAVLPRHLHVPGLHPGAVLAGFLAVPAMLATSHQAYMLLGRGHLREMNQVRLLAAVAYAGGIATLSAARITSPSAYLIVFVGAQALSSMIAGAYCHRCLGVRLVRPPTGAREVLAYGAMAQLGSLSAQTNLRLDQLLMSLWLAPSELGLYVVAVGLASVVAPLHSALSLVVTPAVLAATSPAEAARRSHRHLAFAALVTVPVAGIVSWMAPLLVATIFGPRFAPAAAMARILLAASVFQGINQISGAALRSMGQPGRSAIAEVTGVPITVVLLWILLPRYGGLGAAIASLCAYAVVSALQLVSIRAAVRSSCGTPSRTVPSSAGVAR